MMPHNKDTFSVSSGPSAIYSHDFHTASTASQASSQGSRRRRGRRNGPSVFSHEKESARISRLIQRKLETYMNSEKREDRFDTGGVYRTTDRMVKYDLAYHVFQRMVLDKRKHSGSSTGSNKSDSSSQASSSQASSSQASSSLPAIRPKLQKNSRQVTLVKEASRLEDNANGIFETVPMGQLSMLHRYRPHPREGAITTETGKVQNYTRHFGSALSTQEYIQYYMREGLQCGNPTVSSRFKKLKMRDNTPPEKSQENHLQPEEIPRPPSRSTSGATAQMSTASARERRSRTPSHLTPQQAQRRYDARNNRQVMEQIVSATSDRDATPESNDQELECHDSSRDATSESNEQECQDSSSANNTSENNESPEAVTEAEEEIRDKSRLGSASSQPSRSRPTSSSSNSASTYSQTPDTDTDGEYVIIEMEDGTKVKIPLAEALKLKDKPEAGDPADILSLQHVDRLSWTDELSPFLYENYGDRFSLNTFTTESIIDVTPGASGTEQTDTSDTEFEAERNRHKAGLLMKRVTWQTKAGDHSENDDPKPAGAQVSENKNPKDSTEDSSVSLGGGETDEERTTPSLPTNETSGNDQEPSSKESNTKQGNVEEGTPSVADDAMNSETASVSGDTGPVSGEEEATRRREAPDAPKPEPDEADTVSIRTYASVEYAVENPDFRKNTTLQSQ